MGRPRKINSGKPDDVEDVAEDSREFPESLAESFDLLKGELAKGDRNQDRSLLAALKKHIAFLQNGSPAPTQDASYLADVFRKQSEMGRTKRLEALARSNRDVRWLLEQSGKIKSKQ